MSRTAKYMKQIPLIIILTSSLGRSKCPYKTVVIAVLYIHFKSMEGGVIGQAHLAAQPVEMVYVRRPEVVQIPHQCLGVTFVQGTAFVDGIARTDLVHVSVH